MAPDEFPENEILTRAKKKKINTFFSRSENNSWIEFINRLQSIAKKSY